ncbi:hypothetical protein MNBD_GAMMA22-53 [hydrothermal vent metagenome]|uniref:Phenylacetic acid catabolic family protein n=1 Tax=hydrothermal vent metagenome TaxID=652676 RepID=A0A3B1AAX2_9ZZZZ
MSREYGASSIKLEDFSSMSDEYKKYVIRLLSMQAYAERLGTLEVSKWLNIAPTSKQRRVLAQVIADEAKHSYYLYRELDKIGVSEQYALDIAEGKTNQGPDKHAMEGPLSVGDDDNEWPDIILNAMLLDRAGKHMLKNNTQCSYEPWAKVNQRILVDEYRHEGFGLQEFKQIIKDKKYSDTLKEKFNIWYARALNFFGPPPGKTHKKLLEYGLKKKNNEELRKDFSDEVSNILTKLGLKNYISLSTDCYPFR